MLIYFLLLLPEKLDIIVSNDLIGEKAGLFPFG